MLAISKLSDTQKKFLVEASMNYAEALPGSPAEEHLDSRGISPEVAKQFLLGYVEDSLPGHDMYQGMLCIPYLRPTHDGSQIIASVRFRCVEDHDHVGHGKYNTVHGDRSRMFNTSALVDFADIVALTEGEMDTIVAVQSGVPAVGLPGATTWKRHFREPFLGYETVYVLSDGDKAGQGFAAAVMKDLPNAKQIPMPQGMDVNSYVQERGAAALRERMR